MAVVPGSPLSARSSHDVDTQGHMRASELLVTDGGSTVEPIGRALYGSAVGYETARMKHRTMTRAASCGDTAAVREFLFAGTNVNTKDEFGWNALSRAAFKGHLNTVQFLLSQGAFPDSEDRDGNTALFWATMFDRIEIMEALLKAGCNVNHQSRDGSLAIHVAARWQRESAAVLLAECGADIEEVDLEGRSALQYAEYERLRLAMEDGAYRFESQGGPRIKPTPKEKSSSFCCTS